MPDHTLDHCAALADALERAKSLCAQGRGDAILEATIDQAQTHLLQLVSSLRAG